LPSFNHHFYTLWDRNSRLVPDSSLGKNLARPHLLFENRLIRSRNLLNISKKGSEIRKISQYLFLGLPSFNHHFYTLWDRNSRLVPDSSLGKNLARPHLFFENRLIRSRKLLNISKKGSEIRKISQYPFLGLPSFNHHFYTLWDRNLWMVPNSRLEKNLSRPHLFFYNWLVWSRNLLYICKKDQNWRNLEKNVSKIVFLQPPFLQPLS